MAKKVKETKEEKELEQGLKSSFGEFTNGKSIDSPTMVRVLEDVFRTLIRRKYGSDDNFDVIVDSVGGELEIWRKREIVPDGEVEDERYQIDIDEAKAIDTDNEVGDTCYEPITIPTFGRRAIMAARQTLISRVLELEKDKVYKIFSEKIGELVYGEVTQVLKKEFVITDEPSGAELMLPKSEMIRTDFYRKGDMVRAVVKKVELKNNLPVVILSRTDSMFLERLLEGEVPEIEDGLIIIRKVVRAPGERAKVAVESFDERIDPVGACVGVKGSRIHGIVRELRNENIDVINYSTDDSLFIQRALTPAKVSNVVLDNDRRRAAVYLTAEEVSKAIGKRGLNINLASSLTDYVIDVYREGYDNNGFDVELDEFRDALDGWVIDALKAIGCDTARSVLELTIEELTRRTDLEEETIQEVISILNTELES
jgi:transcription termination/antitermination protein NusA